MAEYSVSLAAETTPHLSSGHLANHCQNCFVAQAPAKSLSHSGNDLCCLFFGRTKCYPWVLVFCDTVGCLRQVGWPFCAFATYSFSWIMCVSSNACARLRTLGTLHHRSGGVWDAWHLSESFWGTSFPWPRSPGAWVASSHTPTTALNKAQTCIFKEYSKKRSHLKTKLSCFFCTWLVLSCFSS